MNVTSLLLFFTAGLAFSLAPVFALDSDPYADLFGPPTTPSNPTETVFSLLAYPNGATSIFVADDFFKALCVNWLSPERADYPLMECPDCHESRPHNDTPIAVTEFTVTRAGNFGPVLLTRSSGNPAFDKAALNDVSKSQSALPKEIAYNPWWPDPQAKTFVVRLSFLPAEVQETRIDLIKH